MDEKAEWFAWGHNGSHHVAGECELVGTYMLSLIPKNYSKKDFWIHPDDRLGVERIKVDRNRIYKEKHTKNILKKSIRYSF